MRRDHMSWVLSSCPLFLGPWPGLRPASSPSPAYSQWSSHESRCPGIYLKKNIFMLPWRASFLSRPLVRWLKKKKKIRWLVHYTYHGTWSALALLALQSWARGRTVCHQGAQEPIQILQARRGGGVASVVPAALGSLVLQQGRLLEADGGPSSLQGPREPFWKRSLWLRLSVSHQS